MRVLNAQRDTTCRWSEFLELVRGSRCQVAASPETASTRGDNQLTPEQYRGAIANYHALGQHATYLFNFFTLGYYPFTDQAYSILRDVASPVTLRGRNKHFMATGEAWHGPALPQTLDEVGRPVGVCLFVGDDLAQAHEDNILLNVELQVRIEGYQLQDDVTIALNERPLGLSSASVEWPPLDEFRRQDNESVWEQRVTEGPFAVVRLQLTESLPSVGVNTVSVTLNQSPRTGGALRITAVDLLVRYDILGVDTALPGDA